jgi:hypothetical protein
LSLGITPIAPRVAGALPGRSTAHTGKWSGSSSNTIVPVSGR